MSIPYVASTGTGGPKAAAGRSLHLVSQEVAASLALSGSVLVHTCINIQYGKRNALRAWKLPGCVAKFRHRRADLRLQHSEASIALKEQISKCGGAQKGNLQCQYEGLGRQLPKGAMLAPAADAKLKPRTVQASKDQKKNQSNYSHQQVLHPSHSS